MPINNNTALAFSNERIRVAANRLKRAYYFAKAAVDEWNNVEMSQGVTLAAGIPNDGLEMVSDGAPGDGRSVIFGDDIHNIVNRMSELITDYETGGKLGTITKVSTRDNSE